MDFWSYPTAGGGEKKTSIKSSQRGPQLLLQSRTPVSFFHAEKIGVWCSSWTLHTRCFRMFFKSFLNCSTAPKLKSQRKKNPERRERGLTTCKEFGELDCLSHSKTLSPLHGQIGILLLLLFSPLCSGYWNVLTPRPVPSSLFPVALGKQNGIELRQIRGFV